MAVDYDTTTKNDRLTVVVNRIDGGAGPGTLEICSAAFAAVLATFTLADPCGTVGSGVLTFDFDPDISDTSADATGTAAVARIKDSAGNVIVNNLSVGTTGTNIVLVTVSLVATQTVTLTTGTITHG